MSALVLSADEARVYRELNKAAELYDWPISHSQLQVAARIACRAAKQGRPREGAVAARQALDLPCGVAEGERDVLVQVAAGFSNSELAEHLGLTKGQVEHRIRRLYGALGASTRTGLVLAGRRAGLLPKVAPAQSP